MCPHHLKWIFTKASSLYFLGLLRFLRINFLLSSSSSITRPRTSHLVLQLSCFNYVGEGLLTQYLSIFYDRFWLHPLPTPIFSLMQNTFSLATGRGHSLACLKLLSGGQLRISELTRTLTGKIETLFGFRMQCGGQVCDLLILSLRAHNFSILLLLTVFAQVQYHTANSDTRFLAIHLLDVLIWLYRVLLSL